MCAGSLVVHDGTEYILITSAFLLKMASVNDEDEEDRDEEDEEDARPVATASAISKDDASDDSSRYYKHSAVSMLFGCVMVAEKKNGGFFLFIVTKLWVDGCTYCLQVPLGNPIST
jgi:hypothetical protein